MGNQQTLDTGMKEMISEEVDRLQKDGKKPFLTVQEVIKMQIPSEDFKFSFAHLGNLYVLDKDRTGKITKDKLYQFAEFCFKQLKNVQTYEFQSQLQAATIYMLWQALNNPDGTENIINWVAEMLIQVNEVKQYQQYEDQLFLGMEAIVIMYEIFNVKMMNELEIQGFFDMLLQCGYENGINSQGNEELEEYISLQVIKDFIREYFKGFCNLMEEIGFAQQNQ